MAVIILPSLYPNDGLHVYPGTNKPVYTNQVMLTFSYEQLIYDISNMAYVEGDITPTDDEHARHQIIDISQEGNIDRVKRVLDLGIAECTEMLYPYSKVEIDEEEFRDDVPLEQDDYYIDMVVPKTIAKNTLDLLEQYIHEYLVCRVLADWMSITNLSNLHSAANWQAKLDDAKSKIHTMMVSRIRRVRRTLNPF